MHKRYEEALVEYTQRKLWQKETQGKFKDAARTTVLVPILEPIGNIIDPEVRASKEFIIHGFDEALEQYRAEQQAKLLEQAKKAEDDLKEPKAVPPDQTDYTINKIPGPRSRRRGWI